MGVRFGGISAAGVQAVGTPVEQQQRGGLDTAAGTPTGQQPQQADVGGTFAAAVGQAYIPSHTDQYFQEGGVLDGGCFDPFETASINSDVRNVTVPEPPDGEPIGPQQKVSPKFTQMFQKLEEAMLKALVGTPSHPHSASLTWHAPGKEEGGSRFL